jgi:hypothetical protein
VQAVLALSLMASLVAVGVIACDSGNSTGANEVTPTGCSPPSGGKPATAPNGYWVNGNTLCTASGRPHLLHGVDRPSLEWNSAGENISPADFALMQTWHVNVVRIALNQDFWLSESPHFVPYYATVVNDAVLWAEQAGMDVILDLHWSDMGNFANMPGQQEMADEHSLEFWKEVAARYKDDGRVFFELYNEPHDVPQNVWLSGGSAGSWTAVGMQQLHDAVRSTGANNVVIVGGLDYAYDLSVVETSPVQGYNIMYATHPYNNAPERQPGQWQARWGYLTATAPVVVTEFGDGCSPDWDTELIAFADKRHASWTAWAWFPGGCGFPSLLTDWNGTTTKPGAVVQAALLGYSDPPAEPPADGGPPFEAGSDASGDAMADAMGDASDDGSSGSGGGPSDGGSSG